MSSASDNESEFSFYAEIDDLQGSLEEVTERVAVLEGQVQRIQRIQRAGAFGFVALAFDASRRERR